jgi:hypothetical protein
MKKEVKYSVLIAGLLALGLAGCQKKEEAPAPEVAPMPAPEAPAPYSESAPPMSEPGMTAPESLPPQEPPAQDDMSGSTPPAQ